MFSNNFLKVLNFSTFHVGAWIEGLAQNRFVYDVYNGIGWLRKQQNYLHFDLPLESLIEIKFFLKTFLQLFWLKNERKVSEKSFHCIEATLILFYFPFYLNAYFNFIIKLFFLNFTSQILRLHLWQFLLFGKIEKSLKLLSKTKKNFFFGPGCPLKSSLGFDQLKDKQKFLKKTANEKYFSEKPVLIFIRVKSFFLCSQIFLMSGKWENCWKINVSF